MRLMLWRLLLLLMLRSASCSCVAADATAFDDEVSLLQTSKGLAVAGALERDQQLQDKLHLAKQARSDVLVTLQRWDDHIAGLESQLLQMEKRSWWQDMAAALLEVLKEPVMQAVRNNSTNTEETKKELRVQVYDNTAFAVLVFGMFLTALYMVWAINKYESTRDEETETVWYLNAACMSETITAATILWLLCGTVTFTQLLPFDIGDETRSLTFIESFYVSAQMVTTVGYGDMTPSTNVGKVFVAIYAFLGVTIVGGLLHELIYLHMLSKTRNDNKDTPKPGKCMQIIFAVTPVMACLIFGTMFFALYPGEHKTYFDCFYMTVITFLTIGFGAYHPVTQTGMLVGTFWMITGVVCFGYAVASLAEMVFHQRTDARMKMNTRELFDKMDKDNSLEIDPVEFLVFELTRNGVAEDTIQDARLKFKVLDADGSGSLSFEEFEEYVKEL